jgi:hypothetical protein
MKEIKLDKGMVTLVDDKDFDFLNQFNWFASYRKTSSSYYAFHHIHLSDIMIFGIGQAVAMHRVIMKTPKGMLCDHIDHDTLNNQRRNLRNVTQAQNQMNRRGPQKNNDETGVLGVSRNGKGFIATIHVAGKVVHFKTRHTIEEAIQDRKEAEIKYYGEYRSGE